MITWWLCRLLKVTVNIFSAGQNPEDACVGLFCFSCPQAVIISTDLPASSPQLVWKFCATTSSLCANFPGGCLICIRCSVNTFITALEWLKSTDWSCHSLHRACQASSSLLLTGWFRGLFLSQVWNLDFRMPLTVLWTCPRATHKHSAYPR